MKRNLYLSTNGMLHRKESTINYITKEGKRAVPIDQVKAIFAVGRISVTSGVISFFSKMGIPIHFFGYYGNYEGSYYPRRRLVSGHALVSQVASFLDKECRMSIAQALVHGCISNMKTVVDSYVSRMNELQIVSTQLELIASEVTGADTIPVLMSLEGRAWSIYYESFNHIIKGFQMGPRVKRPPNNPVNALVSLGNSMLYVTTLTQIYHTQLDPSVSFLHEPLERRFSLALDISEVFKPGLVDTLIFRLLNLGSIKEEHFDAEFKSCMLNDEGRRIFLTAFDERLRETNKHPRLKRSVSNEYLIRLDCYKLLRHVVEHKPFRPYLMQKGM